MAFGHGVRPRAEGGVRVRLAPREREALQALPAQMRPVLSGEAAPAGVAERLFPPAYDDPDAEREFRHLVGDSLAAERLAALDAFERTLAGGSEGRLGWSTDLDRDEAAAWLSAVNDTRLALGALLGIETERAWGEGPDEDDPASMLLYYLGWLEEELVDAMTGELDT